MYVCMYVQLLPFHFITHEVTHSDLLMLLRNNTFLFLFLPQLFELLLRITMIPCIRRTARISARIASIPRRSPATTPGVCIASIQAIRDERGTTAVVLLAGLLELLSEGGAGAQGGSLPVDDVDGDDKDEGDGEEDGGCDLQVVLATDVGIEWGRWQGEDTGEEVAGPAVAAGSGGGIGSIGADHVVNGGHVDGVVGDADDGGEEHGAHPMDWGAAAGPGEADKAKG